MPIQRATALVRRPLFVAFGSAQQLFHNNILESQWSGGGGRGVRARGHQGRVHDVHARGELVGCPVLDIPDGQRERNDDYRSHSLRLG